MGSLTSRFLVCLCALSLVAGAACSSGNTKDDPPPDKSGKKDDPGKKDGPDAPPKEDWPPSATETKEKHPEWFACADDNECVAVELGCCDHCNGGLQWAFNKAHVETATEELKQKQCTKQVENKDGTVLLQQMQCTKKACADKGAICKFDKCRPVR